MIRTDTHYIGRPGAQPADHAAHPLLCLPLPPPGHPGRGLWGAHPGGGDAPPAGVLSPVTGRVDQGTWDAIVALYHQALVQLSSPLPVTTSPGDESVHLNSAQSMFRGLSEVLDGVEPGAVNGRHDGPTTRNLQWLQRAGGRPETGRLDPESQHTLEQLYRIFVTHAQSPWLTRPELLGGS